MALLDAGSGLLIAGVAAQVVNMVVCGGIILHFTYNYRRHTRGPMKSEQGDTSQYATDKTNSKLRRNFNGFCWALFVAYIAVLIRCIYR
jgi:major membrane immunogen (membrane-anchored lipoprotein)